MCQASAISTGDSASSNSSLRGVAGTRREGKFNIIPTCKIGWAEIPDDTAFDSHQGMSAFTKRESRSLSRVWAGGGQAGLNDMHPVGLGLASIPLALGEPGATSLS